MHCVACGESTASDPCTACGGSALLDGRYRLEARLGDGGTGTAWRATRLADDRVVMVKESVLHGAEASRRRELVVREADVLRQLDHPGIPAWLDTVEVRQGRARILFLVQAFVPGVDLAEEQVQRRYSLDEVLDLLADLLGILAYLHERSPPVVHRDVKPANVRRRPDGSLALVDFGSVRDALQGELGGRTVVGTFGFMAPEQMVGDASPASDVYGAGATAIALLTRRDPQALLDRGARMAWAGHVALEARWVAWLSRLVAAEPADRPRDAGAALRELEVLRSAPAGGPTARAGSLPPLPDEPDPTDDTDSGQPAPTRFAEPLRGDEPEPFHQPPAVRDDARRLEADIRTSMAAGRKIAAIKHVRECTGLGLREAKLLVEHVAAGGSVDAPVRWTPPSPPTDDAVRSARFAVFVIVLVAVTTPILLWALVL